VNESQLEFKILIKKIFGEKEKKTILTFTLYLFCNKVNNNQIKTKLKTFKLKASPNSGSDNEKFFLKIY
jgi:hypothetical protein